MKIKLLALFILITLAFINLNAQSIGTGLSNHTIAVNSDGTVYTWGRNNSGQLGNGTNTSSNVPVAVVTSGVLNGKTIIQIASGIFHSIALTSDGKVYTWGYNYYGQLGNGNNTDSNVPVSVVTSGVLSGKTIVYVTCGGYHSIAVASDGTVYTWGFNSDGQLGNGTTAINSNVPVAVVMSGVLSGKVITKVAAGSFSSTALASDGTVYSWGYNFYGQLGNGTNTSSNVPVAVVTSGVLNGKTITQIAGGTSHSMALASDGTIYSWGYNPNGQLGDGSTGTGSNVPIAVITSGVLSGKVISRIACGLSHSIALSSDGNVYTWGYNGYGQLGNGNYTSSSVPVEIITSGVLSGKTVTQIAGGYYHTIALASDGTLYTWGFNTFGQLGNTTTTNSNEPVAVNQTSMGLLPVELINFFGVVSKNNVILNWQTATEVNNYGFDIECKSSNEEWRIIGFVSGNGNSNSLKEYSFTDKNPPSGKIKYRLKQIDIDGSFSYSNEVEINTEIPKIFSLQQNYPNPFNPSTTFEFTIPEDGLTTLKIYDFLGQEIQTLVNEELKSGQIHRVNFDGSRLASGIYFYKLESKNHSAIKKFILMK